MRTGALLLLLSAASAQDLTPEEQAALQAAIVADTTPVAPTPTPTSTLDVALILDVAAAWFSTDEPAQLGAHDPQQTGFNLQQLEMSLSSNIDPFFRLDANLVFSQFGVEVEEAYGTTLALPGGLQVRAGQFLTRIGRLNNTHPHSWDFVDQPLVNGKFFGGEGNRGLGAEVSILLPLPWYVEWVASLTDAGGACCARSYYGDDPLPVRDPRDLLTTTTVEQFFDWTDWGLFWGVSYQSGPNPSGKDNRSEIYASDLHLRWRPRDSDVRRAVTLQAEGMYRRRQVPNRVLEDVGAYAQLVYQHDPRWAFGLRHEWVDGVADDPLDPEWTSARQRSAAQITAYPSHFSRIRLQTNLDQAEWLGDPQLGVFLALELLAGAHGAHEY